MSDGHEGSTPPTPPPDDAAGTAPPSAEAPRPSAPQVGEAEKKKGLSALAWVGIGCGVLVAVTFVGCLTLGAVGLSWLSSKVAEFEANPAMASAKIVVQTNPELELVSSDDEAQTLTIRNRETGEVITVDLDEIQQGRIRFESGDEEITLGFEEGAREGEGSLTIEDRAGNTRFRVGSGGEADVPDWVPRYPGITLQGTYVSQTGDEVAGGFTLEIDDDIDDVIAFYQQALEEAGFSETSRATSEQQGARHASLTATSGDRTVGVMASSQEDATQVVVSFSEGL